MARMFGMRCFIMVTAFLAGCGSFNGPGLKGYLYVHTRTPYTLDLNETPVVQSEGQGTIIHIKEPVSGYGLYAEFNSNAIGDIAAYHGLKQVYWADLEYFSILGIWKARRLHVYGSTE